MLKEQKEKAFYISIFLYFVAIITLAGAYNEVVGDIRVFGKFLSVNRSKGECMLSIGSAFLPVLIARLIEIFNYTEIRLLTVFADTLRIGLGASYMLVIGVMLEVVLLGANSFNVLCKVLLVVSCAAMVWYAILEYISAVQYEIQKFFRLNELE